MNVISSQKVDTNRHELKIQVDKDTFQDAIMKSYKKNVGKVTVPGFRKGKAPKAIIEKMYGPEFFYEDAVNFVYGDAYQAAVEETGIEPVDYADVEINEVGPEGLTFTATVTVKPEVEISQYKGIKGTKTVYTVTDDEVDDELARMQDQAGRMVTIEDRAAENGDIACIDFEGFLDGKAFEGGKGTDYELTLGSGSFIPGFEEQVAGHKTGESFDVNVTFPEGYHAEELAGKAVVFKVTIKKLEKKELPPLDDELVKDVSEFDTLDELKADIKKKIEENKDRQAQTRLEDQLMTTLVDEYMKAEIPQAMIDSKIDEQLQDYDYRLRQQGMDLESYMKYTGNTADTMRQTFEPSAKRQVKMALAMEKIAQLENLTASEEEIAAEYQKVADAYGLELEKVKEIIPEKDIVKEITNHKAIDTVVSSADVTLNVVDKAAVQAEAATAAAAGEAVKVVEMPAEEEAEAQAPAEAAQEAEKAPEEGKKKKGSRKKAGEEPGEKGE